MAGPPRLASPGLGTRGQTSPVGTVQHETFFLAATGDVEEDGGVSDSLQTSKLIPLACCVFEIFPFTPSLPTPSLLTGRVLARVEAIPEEAETRGVSPFLETRIRGRFHIRWAC